MDRPQIEAVLFDLGDTLGATIVGGQPRRLIRFDLFPNSLKILARLRSRGLKLGVISNTGSDKAASINQILEPKGILSDLDPGCSYIAVTKVSRRD